MANNTTFVDFRGKWIVVTGASSGVGRAIAIELSRRGARLVLIGRDQRRLEETARLTGRDSSVPLVLDLVRTETIYPAIQDVKDTTGRLYGLCHAAGVVTTRPLASMTADVCKSMFEVNVFAGIELARGVCRRDTMEEEGGSILFISSSYGKRGIPGQIGYCAAKSAIYGAMRAMAVELAPRRIRVNSISPGLVRTAMTEEAFRLLSTDQAQRIEENHPLGAGTPEDVAGAAVFILAPQSLWITGADFAVDGGFSAR